VGERVSLFREPDAGNLPVRFDEREQEPGPGQTGLRRAQRKPNPTATGRLQLLRLFSTLLDITLSTKIFLTATSPCTWQELCDKGQFFRGSPRRREKRLPRALPSMSTHQCRTIRHAMRVDFSEPALSE
jgi:hypothetical protein